MIPAIKESNQVKAFLGIKDHYPEFYNEAWDLHQSGAKPAKEVPGYIKEFMVEKSSKENELIKFITSVNPKHPNRSNMRYSMKQDNLGDSPVMAETSNIPQKEKQLSLQSLLKNSGR